MPLSTRAIGMATDEIVHDVDARWIMAYAAGIGDLNPRYLDSAGDNVIGHPLFPVCVEWPAVLASRHLPGYQGVTAEEGARGVHAAHDLHIFRPIRAGDRLHTRATVTGVEQIRPGAAVMIRLDTRDQTGELVCRTYQLGISRGVAVVGEPAADGERAPAAPVLSNGSGTSSFEIPVAAGSAHIYTECARIWNPIHTDRSVALAAGLPDIILHGTATLALAVSRLVDEFLGADPTRVRRLGGRFSAMVRMPTTLTLDVTRGGMNLLGFAVRTPEGDSAFSGGYLCFD